MDDQTTDIIDRKRGCFFGLAIGDALGAAVEFKRPGSFVPVDGYRDGGPHGLKPGEWTDDTSMALALADSITATGWDLNDQASRYVRWWLEGAYSVNGRCFDIGNTVSSALYAFEQHGDARKSASDASQASGNGSIMRLAPIPIRYASDPIDVRLLSERSAESSLPTHASDQCLSACRYMSLVIAGLINGVDRAQVLAPDWELLNELRDLCPLHPAVEIVVAGSYRELQPPEIQGSGYAVKSLEAALWAFHKADSFEKAVLSAVNLGHDADTTGAVCGQFAGAYWGLSGISDALAEGLAQRSMIQNAIEGLLKRD